MKTAAKSNPQREAAKGPRERIFTTEIMVWQGIALRVKYEPNWLGGTSTAHLELDVLDPDGAPLPVTDTGYRSHFLSCGIVEECGGPAAYVQRWLDETARGPAWRGALARWQQLSLF